MEIYIPTRGRVFQETYDSLPKELKDRVWFVVPFRGSCLTLTERVLMTPASIEGIGPTRQWIIEREIREAYRDPIDEPVKVVMLDDDLVFATRRDDEPSKFRNSSATEILQLFEDIKYSLNTYAHVGVATREGGNVDTNRYAYNTRLLRILAYRVDVLRRHSIRFDNLEFMEDFDVTLQLLRAGYENCKINWIVHNQRSSNAPGGCSTYRTLEGQAKAARRLKERHTEFVTVVEKTTKSAWNGQTRTDVRIGWKKALGHDSAGKIAVVDSRAQSGNVEEGIGSRTALEL